MSSNPEDQTRFTNLGKTGTSPSNEGVRHRFVNTTRTEESKTQVHQETSAMKPLKPSLLHDLPPLSFNSYWLTRIILLRYLAFIYCVAFLVALHQNTALIGHRGLLPADAYLNSVAERAGSSLTERLLQAPTLFWFFDYSGDRIDALLYWTALAGLSLAAVVMVRGAANIPIMLVLWALYHSIVNVGQRWYSFGKSSQHFLTLCALYSNLPVTQLVIYYLATGWESQLLETGFLAAFLCPVISLKRFPHKTPTSLIVLFAYRWLIFRIMIGAGLIKLRGDKCWKDLTCMNYHYETQPVPNPISYYMHQEPVIMHKLETLSNHFIELIVPILVLLTRRLRIIGGTIQILFQVILIISGNLSFLNWLTIVPSLACFDDASLAWFFSKSTKRQVPVTLSETVKDKEVQTHHSIGCYVRRAFNISLGCMIAYLSIPIVQNLLSSRQIMNTSFDPLRLVNTYGAFGSITKERTEIIFEGTVTDDPTSLNADWLEYDFKCKPGNISRRPCLISPYHYRLDWLMWFAAFQNYQHNPWLIHLTAKFLVNDEPVMSLIAHNPFEGKRPPKWVRAEHYRYVFSANGTTWWERTHIGNYLPPLSLRSIRDYMTAMGWTMPRLNEK